MEVDIGRRLGMVVEVDRVEKVEMGIGNVVVELVLWMIQFWNNNI